MIRLKGRRPRGFTLIEVMIVSAIIGILSSVAIPEYLHYAMRAKTSERKMLMIRVKQGVQDAYLRNQLPVNATLSGAATPATVGAQKGIPNWSQAGWNVVFASSDIEGAVYYQYSFAEEEPVGNLTIIARGDVDGDGNPSIKTCVYQRVNGAYQIDTVRLAGTGCTCAPAAVATNDCEPEDMGVY